MINDVICVFEKKKDYWGFVNPSIILSVFIISFMLNFCNCTAQEQISLHVYEYSGYFSADEVSRLEEYCLEYGKKTNANIIILVEDGVENNQWTSYMEDFYDANDDILGNTAMILLDLQENDRRVEIQGYGEMEYIISNGRISNIINEILPDLKNGNYYTALVNFILNVYDYYLMEDDREEIIEVQTEEEKVLSDFALSQIIYNDLDKIPGMHKETSNDYTNDYVFNYFDLQDAVKIEDIYGYMNTTDVMFCVRDNVTTSDGMSTLGDEKKVTWRMYYDFYVKNYKFLAFGSHKPSGMQAGAFLSTEGDIVIAYRGTEKNGIGDLATDFGLGFGQNVEQYTYAERFYQNIYDKYIDGNERRIRLAGHSLGGGLAGYVSMRHDLPAVCINDPSGYEIYAAYANDPYAVEKFEGVNSWKFVSYVNKKVFDKWNRLTGNLINAGIILQNLDERKHVLSEGNLKYIVDGNKKDWIYNHGISSLLKTEVENSQVKFSLFNSEIKQTIEQPFIIKYPNSGTIDYIKDLILGGNKNDEYDYKDSLNRVLIYTGGGDDVFHGSQYDDIMVASAGGTKSFFGGDENDTYIIDPVLMDADIHINDGLGNNTLHVKNIDVRKLNIMESSDDYYFELDGNTVYINKNFQKKFKFYIKDGTNQITLPLKENTNYESGNIPLRDRETSAERNIVLVLDSSESMNGKPVQETKEAALNFVDKVLKEDAGIGIVTYSDSAAMKADFSMDQSYLDEVINSIHTSGKTNIESGLAAAYKMLENSGGKKKIIVLMSDGEPNKGKEGEKLIEYADSLKQKGIYIYTLGFFEALDTQSEAQRLMEAIASSGCHYEVDDAESLIFFFQDIADQINGQKYIYVRIACPVEVAVSYHGETLNSYIDQKKTRTSFGTLTFEENMEESDSTKILRLKENNQYDIQIMGTGIGRMDYTIGFMNGEGEYTDFRRFQDIIITPSTVIDTIASTKGKTVLNIDEDGDGDYDLKYKAGVNGYGELVDNHYVLYTVLGTVFIIICVGIYKKQQGGIK